jgi:hypothetical protein
MSSIPVRNDASPKKPWSTVHVEAASVSREKPVQAGLQHRVTS